MQHNGSVTDLQQLKGRWTTLLSRLHDDPKVTQVMETRIGRYLSSHPFLALTLMVFSAMATVPTGLFLLFALVTIIVSAVGFVFVEGFLLCAAGVTLLCVLSGLALFSVVVSFICLAFYVILSNILNYPYPQLTKQGNVQGMESDFEPSKLQEMQ